MCLILLAKNAHPDYKLIIAANRDEFYKRKTKKAHFWKEAPKLLAGRDMEAGGTWMGVNKEGRIAMLTNYRDPFNIKEKAPSRGFLVSDFLKTDENTGKYLSQVEQNASAYNGFNLICGTPDQLYYFGNYQDGVHPIENGIHGLSNKLLDTPWPKVTRGKQKLKELISGSFSALGILEVLYDDIKAPAQMLPDTGVGAEMEAMLSSMFIKSPDYGSRCSTVVMVSKQNNLTFLERTYNIHNFSYDDVSFEFKF